ncbi:histidinol dehydrogenase [Salidesulfovibrio onnuriiensis]|uniref:histidinol dehydrogenase n=1 Tax=Salidesulfovibrio onnuriiensis TaxID=2583823 RepID=UPI0011CC0ADD|nr:histidinol dehydrogenase [Salidesulfovibrio onnuriiensis]
MSFSFPDWLEPHLLDDAVMGEAYASVPDERRALLKTSIARLWEWYGPSCCTAQRLERLFRGGFTAAEMRSPVGFAVFVCGADMNSPAQLLAALVPAIAAGVLHILAVKPCGTGWTQPQLVGLELAGVEMVAELDQDTLQRLLRELAQGGESGRLVYIDAEDAVSQVGKCSPGVLSLNLGKAAAVVRQGEGGNRFDLDALAFAQAGTRMTYFGDASDVDDSVFSCADREFEYALTQDASVAFLPAGDHSRAAAHFSAVMGPGHESSWIWTEIDANTFVDTRVTWSDGEES